MSEPIHIAGFTQYQNYLIEKAFALGRGYAIFAHNVKQQGWCSPKQETALSNMVAAGTYRKNNWKQSSGRKSNARRTYIPEGDSGDQYAEGLSFDED